MLGAHPQMICQKYPGLVTMELGHKLVTTQLLPVAEFILVFDSLSLFFLLAKCWDLNPGLHVYWARALLLGYIYRSRFVVLRLK